MHVQVDVDSAAGTALIWTAMLGGAHGELITGTHGAGVNTPDAAVVAACTAGFAGLRHMPNELMFTPTAKS